MEILRTVPARWPYCEIDLNQQTHPAIAVEWQKIADANGIPTWYLKVVYWDGAAKTAVIPRQRVRRVGD